jgi:CBS domain containing-hemolysin-like protein
LIFSKLDDFTYIFEGKTTLKDFYRVTKIKNEEDFEVQKGESETIAGFVLEIAGSFPKRGEIVTYIHYQFLVESLDKKRLKQIKVTLPHEY